jgi:hypothetical protein
VQNRFENKEECADSFNDGNVNAFQEYEEDRLCHEAIEQEEYKKNSKLITEMVDWYDNEVPGFADTERIRTYLDDFKFEYKLSDLFYKIASANIDCYYPYTMRDGTIFMGKINNKCIQNTAINVDLNGKIFLVPNVKETLEATPIHGLQNRLTLTIEQVHIKKTDKQKLRNVLRPIKIRTILKPAKKDQHEIYALRHALKHTVDLMVELVNLRPDIFKVYKESHLTGPFPFKGNTELDFNMSWLACQLETTSDKIADSTRTRKIISDALKSF